jgi:hypothetical protein
VVTVGFSCYSSRVLYNCEYEGNVLPAVQDDHNHDLYKDKILERPKVLYKVATKQFVLWMRVDMQNYALVHDE